MCRLGATDEELAEHFNVCVRTIYRWRNTHEEFAEAVVAGKEHADARVERALYSRAVGCSVERTKIFKHAGDSKPIYATYTHHFPPDPNAALQWLRVRQPETWVVQKEQEEEEGGSSLAEFIRLSMERDEYENARSAARHDDHREAPPEAAAPEPSPETPPERDARPAPPPDPIPPPEPQPAHGQRRQGHCPLFYPKPPG